MLPRLIAIDLDGTLLNSDSRVSSRNLASLKLAEAGGAEVVIATGRRHCYAMRVLRDLGLSPASALVSSNGTVIRTLGAKLLHRTHLSRSLTLWLCDHLRDFRNTMMLTFDTVGPTGEDSRGALVCEHLDELHASIGRWMQTNAPYIQHVAHLEDVLVPGYPGGQPIQMMLCGTVDRMAAAEARLLEDPRVTAVGADLTASARPGVEINLHRTSYPDRDLSIVDILPAGCSKASALERVAHLRGLTAGAILAIGDNWNDLPMLRHAGHAVLMANAPAELLALGHQHGWQIAPSNDDDGVAAALEEIFQPATVLTAS